MKKLIFVFLLLFITSCTEKKPPLKQTQIVDNKSIVMPPEFYILPKPRETTAVSQQN